MSAIPSSLFNTNLSTKSFKNCFSNCGTRAQSSIVLNEELFSRCSSAIDFSFCFKDANITDIPIELFKENVRATNFESCFENTPIKSIPSDIFIENKEITNLNNCFKNCQNITIISNRLLLGCEKLKTAVGLFSNTNIRTIPDNLFTNQTKVIDLSGCFENTNIIYLTDGVFISCYNLENLSNCFNGCQDLVGMDKYTLRSNTKLKNVSGMFRNARLLSELPLEFFKHNPEINNFSYCFQNCTNCLFNNPFDISNNPNRFNSITSKINFNYMFNNMSDDISEGTVVVPEIWNYNYKQVPSSVGTFRKSKNTSYISNYNSIPDNWK